MSAKNKILLTVALPAEAAPVLQRFGLTRDQEAHEFAMYRNDELALIVSGMGKVRMGAATSYALARSDAGAIRAAVNIGIAGASADIGADLGDLFLIHRICDSGTGREFFPDMLLDTGLAESQVTTFDRPVTTRSSGIPEAGLVDMEASGFFETASLFLAPHNISCLKVVSDHLAGTPLKKDVVSEFIERNGETIERYLAAVRVAALEEGDFPGEEAAAWMEQVSERLRLTASQRHMLMEWLAQYTMKKEGDLSGILSSAPARVKTKQEGKRHLEKLRRKLQNA